MAEGFAKKFIAEYKLEGVTARSCGTYASPDFIVPGIVLELLKKEGVDESKHVSTPVTGELVKGSDLILAMEKTHLADIISLYPSAKNKTFLFKDYAGVLRDGEISDPMGQPDGVYVSCAEEIKKCEIGLFKKLFKKA
jgi:protein-tyrosine phosphatase